MILRDLMRLLGSARRDGRNLTHEEAFRAFEMIFSGGQSEIQIGAFLIALRWKGVTVEELAAFAEAARAQATIPCQDMPNLVCVCSPQDGSDHVPPLDVAAGLVAAAAGVRVLLVSDRCVPPKRGLTAASVLERLGVNMTWDPAEAEDWVAKTRFAATSASGMLPALMGLRRVRGEIGVRTPLSTVEKLICPRSAAVLVGAQAGPVLGVAVEVMQGLGHTRACAIQGVEGGIIPSVRKRTRGIELSGEHLVSLVVEPDDFGLSSRMDPELPLFSPAPDGQGAGDTPLLVKAAGEMNALVLAGEPGEARNAALLGAALILKVAGRCMTLAEGVDAAIASLDSGEASAVLNRLRELQS